MVDFGYLLPTRGIVSSSDGSAELTARVQSDAVDISRRAESLGFDSLWVGDSVLAKPRLEPLSTLSAVSTATESVDLGTAVYLPNLRHPVHVAHQTATLDRLSGGRFSLAVGVGVRPPEREEMEQLGVEFERRGAMLNEGLSVLRDLWSGEPVSIDGEFYDLSEASIGFQPCRPPSVYVASAAFDPRKGFPRTIRERLAEHADGWMPISMSSETFAAGAENLGELLEDAGRDPGRFDRAYYIDVVIDESEAAAIDQARAFLKRYYGGQVSYDSDEAFSDEDVRERGVFGPRERVAEYFAEFADAGVEEFVVRFTADSQREQLNRFAPLLDRL